MKISSDLRRSFLRHLRPTRCKSDAPAGRRLRLEVLEDRRVLDGIPGSGVADFTYDAGTGQMWVDTDGVDNISSLVVEGPKATNVDPWGSWYKQTLPGTEQWLVYPAAFPEGYQQIATYERGLTQADFGQVEYGTHNLQDLTEPGGIVDTSIQVLSAATVIDRHVFYNNSALDGSNSAANGQDDGAVATDKDPLLPGQTATFDNYTSYSRGINGVMVDIENLKGTPTASDFEFRVGNTSDPSSWAPVDAPTISVREGDGDGGSDRVSIIFNDGAIENQWLQVTVLGNTTTGLLQDDVFYFGNAVGEAGDWAGQTLVNATDQIFARNNQTGSAAVDNPYDYNRDGQVDGNDEVIARDHQTDRFNSLVLFDAPAASGFSPAPPEAESAEGDAPAGDSTDEAAWVYDLAQANAASGQSDTKDDDPITQAVDKLLASYF